MGGVWIGQAGRARAQGGERLRGAAACGERGFKESVRPSGERPIGAASFIQQHNQASCQPPPPPGGCSGQQFVGGGGLASFWRGRPPPPRCSGRERPCDLIPSPSPLTRLFVRCCGVLRPLGRMRMNPRSPLLPWVWVGSIVHSWDISP